MDANKLTRHHIGAHITVNRDDSGEPEVVAGWLDNIDYGPNYTMITVKSFGQRIPITLNEDDAVVVMSPDGSPYA